MSLSQTYGEFGPVLYQDINCKVKPFYIEQYQEVEIKIYNKILDLSYKLGKFIQQQEMK